MDKNKKRVFISHSTRDRRHAGYLVDLLRAQGLTRDNLFCSSYPGFDISVGSDIFDFLKNQFDGYELLVVFLISKENYYSSAASLNEMGAAWVRGFRSIPVLLPGTTFRDLQGVVTSAQLSVVLDSTEAKFSLNSLMGSIREFLSLPDVNQSAWEQDRDSYLEKTRSTPVVGETRGSIGIKARKYRGELLDGTVDIKETLFRLIELAIEEGLDELATWAEYEVQGYPEDSKVPDYRLLQSISFTWSGIAGNFTVANASLPISDLTSETLDKVKNIRFVDAIGVVMESLNESGQPAFDRSMLAQEVYAQSKGKHQCARLVQNISRGQLERIIAAVKTRVIQELVKLEKSIGNAPN